MNSLIYFSSSRFNFKVVKENQSIYKYERYVKNMSEGLLIARQQTAAFNSGLSIINRLDEEFRKIKIAYMTRDGYAIMDAIERLYAELISELNGVKITIDKKTGKTILSAEEKSEFEEGETLRRNCNKIIDSISINNNNRDDKQITKPILMTRDMKEILYSFELWTRIKLKEKGMMMPSKDIEDVRLIMGKA